MPSTIHTRSAALARLAGAVLLVAALAAGVAVPAAAALTAAAGWADAHRAPLPAELVTPAEAQLTRIYAADGSLITTFYDEDRHDVGLARMAPVMRQAIVAAEDTRFYRHGGVDLRGVVRALVSDSRAASAEQGASTLTMQYVRNVSRRIPA